MNNFRVALMLLMMLGMFGGSLAQSAGRAPSSDVMAALSQVYQDPYNPFRIRHPQGWRVRFVEGLVVAVSEGELHQSPTVYLLPVIVVDRSQSASRILRNILDKKVFPVFPRVTLTAQPREAEKGGGTATAEGTFSTGGVTSTVRFALARRPNGLAIFKAYAAPAGAFAKMLPLLSAIAAGYELTAPKPLDVYTGPHKSLWVEYPRGWKAEPAAVDPRQFMPGVFDYNIEEAGDENVGVTSLPPFLVSKGTSVSVWLEQFFYPYLRNGIQDFRVETAKPVDSRLISREVAALRPFWVDYSGRYQGVPIRGRLSVAVASGPGQDLIAVASYHAPVDKFRMVEPTLLRILLGARPHPEWLKRQKEEARRFAQYLRTQAGANNAAAGQAGIFVPPSLGPDPGMEFIRERMGSGNYTSTQGWIDTTGGVARMKDSRGTEWAQPYHGGTWDGYGYKDPYSKSYMDLYR